MNKNSRNIVFVYGLLLIDLLINITDNLIPIDQAQQSYHLSLLGSKQYPTVSGGDRSLPPESNAQIGLKDAITSSLTFSIFILQVLSIVCVVASLLSHFFEIADQVRQTACLRVNDEDDEGPLSEPLPQRIALKLVLDKYWWSLLVGLLYLVLTIILHIIKIDPNWHRSGQISAVGGLGASESSLSGQGQGLGLNDNKKAHNRNLLPILTVLIHKLMSTCYYVSFVVVYRASPGQMVSRVLQVAGGKSGATTG